MLDTDQIQSLLQKIFLPVSIMLLIASAYGFYGVLNVEYGGLNNVKHADVISKVPEVEEHSDYTAIAEWSLFGNVTTPPHKETVKPVVLPESKLPLELIGVIHSADELQSVAIIKSDQQHRLFRIDDVLPGNARIVNIEKNQVTFSRSGNSELLKLVKFENRSGDIGNYERVISPQFVSRSTPDDWD